MPYFMDGNRLKSNDLKTPDKVLRPEAVFLRMIEEAAHHPMQDEGPEDLFAIESTTGLKHAVHFCYCPTPVGHVMDDAKVEDGVVLRIIGGDRTCIANPEIHARPEMREPIVRPTDHPRVEIESVDAVCAETLDDDLDTNATPASDFQRAAALHHATQPEQTRRFDVALDSRTHRIVHQCILEMIQEHQRTIWR